MVTIPSIKRAFKQRVRLGLRVTALVLLLGLSVMNESRAEQFDSSGWQRFRDVSVAPSIEAGPVGIALESAILERCKPDRTDIRLVSSQGELVPVTLTDSVHYDDPTPFPAVLYKIVKRPGKWTDVWIDKKAKVLTRGVLVQTGSKDFARKVEIRGSDTGTESYVILMDGLICDLPGPIPVRSLELYHPLNNFRYIQLRILDDDLPPLKVEGALCLPAPGSGSTTRATEIRIVENRMNASDNSTVIIADLGEKRSPFAGIKISTPTASFVKRVRLLAGSSESPDSWRPFYEGTFFRIERADAAKENLEARFEPQNSRYLMLEFTGSGPLVTVKALDAKEALKFAAFPHRVGLSYRLYYDNPQAKAPAAAAPQPSLNLSRIVATASDVTLGNEQKNLAVPRPRQIQPPKTAYPTTLGRLLGMAMLLIGLLLLFAVMLRARSQRRAERRRGSRVYDNRL
jgi:hypothetical protein